MSSIAGRVTHPVFGAYPVGKTAIEAMMRNAADEYGPAGVRCNAVAPGFTETEIMAGIPRDSSVYESYIRNTPLGCVGQPEDVAEAVRFLIGPESRFVTGVVLEVDGGHHLRTGPDFRPFTGLSAAQLLGRD
jgi:NAD(P)-dependent dehydrogenase (short-subunit alcohol dehydrogenase family)